VNETTLIGRWELPSHDTGTLSMLQDCLEPVAGKFHFYFVLSRS
jgi:hypothetical protein